MDYAKINQAAENYKDDMTRFLRAIVRNPGESCDEKAHVETIAAEMKRLDFDEVTIDPQGNVMGFMGTGDKIIAYDAHIDTVGIGNIDNWNFDPYEGYETDEEIGGPRRFRPVRRPCIRCIRRKDHERSRSDPGRM